MSTERGDVFKTDLFQKHLPTVLIFGSHFRIINYDIFVNFITGEIVDKHSMINGLTPEQSNELDKILDPVPLIYQNLRPTMTIFKTGVGSACVGEKIQDNGGES
jgi:hypothetical protein